MNRDSSSRAGSARFSQDREQPSADSDSGNPNANTRKPASRTVFARNRFTGLHQIWSGACGQPALD